MTAGGTSVRDRRWVCLYERSLLDRALCGRMLVVRGILVTINVTSISNRLNFSSHLFHIRFISWRLLRRHFFPRCLLFFHIG